MTMSTRALPRLEWQLSFTIATVVALSPAAAMAADPAMLTDVAGQCEMTDLNDDIYECQLLQTLQAGSVVNLGADGRVVMVYLDTGEEFRFSAGATIRVTQDRPEPEGGKSETRKLDRFGSTELSPLTDAKLAQATMVMRSATSRLELVWPLDVTLMSREPVFEWDAGGKEGAFTLVVDRADGSRFDLRPAGDDTKMALSRSLEPGESYVWWVQQRGSKRSASGSFSVIDDAQRVRLLERLSELQTQAPNDDAPFSERVLYAAILHANGFDEAARERWQALHRERPEIETLSNLAKSR